MDNFLTAMDKLGQEQGNAVTLVHDQELTNLCHSYATMSAFRQIILLFLEENEKSADLFDDLHKTRQDIISGVKSKTGDLSFARMLTIFLGCVSPRSFKCSTSTQAAYTETVIARLCSKTAFEVEGWKRILPIRNVFEKLKLKIDNYELTYEHHHHIYSNSVQSVLKHLLGQQRISPYYKCTQNKFEVNTIIQLATPNGNLGHAVVIWKIDRNNYYMKNSYTNEPEIIIPKYRTTWNQYDLIRKAHSFNPPRTQAQIINMFNTILRISLIEPEPSDWLIRDTGFHLKFTRKKTPVKNLIQHSNSQPVAEPIRNAQVQVQNSRQYLEQEKIEVDKQKMEIEKQKMEIEKQKMEMKNQEIEIRKEELEIRKQEILIKKAIIEIEKEKIKAANIKEDSNKLEIEELKIEIEKLKNKNQELIQN